MDVNGIYLKQLHVWGRYVMLAQKPSTISAGNDVGGGDEGDGMKMVMLGVMTLRQLVSIKPPAASSGRAKG